MEVEGSALGKPRGYHHLKLYPEEAEPPIDPIYEG